MSVEHAHKFIDLVSSDPQLQEEVKEKQGNLVDLAAQKGFTFTQEELHDAMRSRWGTDPSGPTIFGGCRGEDPDDLPMFGGGCRTE